MQGIALRGSINNPIAATTFYSLPTKDIVSLGSANKEYNMGAKEYLDHIYSKVWNVPFDINFQLDTETNNWYVYNRNTLPIVLGTMYNSTADIIGFSPRKISLAGHITERAPRMALSTAAARAAMGYVDTKNVHLYAYANTPMNIDIARILLSNTSVTIGVYDNKRPPRQTQIVYIRGDNDGREVTLSRMPITNLVKNVPVFLASSLHNEEDAEGNAMARRYQITSDRL